jgi:hypothetical protein
MFGLAGSSRAASGAVCTTSSNLTSVPIVYASCVKQSLLPHKVNVGNDTQSIMQFTNQGGSTASHVSLQTAFSPGVTVNDIRLLKNGVEQSRSSCTPTTFPAANMTLVKCSDFANFASGDTGRLVVRFTSSSPTVTVTSSAFYAESGSDNGGGPNGTRNDNQTGQPDSVQFVASGEPASGGCTTAGGTFTDGDATQFTKVTYNATSDSSLLCSPAGAAVLDSVAGLQTKISVVEIGPQAGAGYAIAKIDFTPLPPNTTIKKLVLKEDTSVPPAALFSKFITVPDGCDATTGLPPNPGVPEAGATDLDTNHHNDSCITGRDALPKGGGEITMHVIANPFDGKYGS